MDSSHSIKEKTHHIDELSMCPSEMDLAAILRNSDILVAKIGNIYNIDANVGLPSWRS